MKDWQQADTPPNVDLSDLPPGWHYDERYGAPQTDSGDIETDVAAIIQDWCGVTEGKPSEPYLTFSDARWIAKRVIARTLRQPVQ